ncbi:MAG: PEP-utilizing enzyme [Helicobacter sp.]|nr:PEP-utilizing enzyme [Helicobacter sp.]
MRLKFSTKAQNLKNLQSRLKSAKILPLLVITKVNFKQNSQEVLNSIYKLKTQNLILRSSSRAEDSKSVSNAGAFLSIANVESQNKKAVLEALLKVADSMPNADDEILIQPSLENIDSCGVAFSVDKDNFAPYYCIEYDKSGSTHSITDGSSKEKFSFYAHREIKEVQNKNLAQVITLLRELEGLFNYPYLDVEFAFSEGELYCLQVRPLVKGELNLSDKLPLVALERLSRRVVNLQKARVGVYGSRSIFGVMPDWNPAEIIGLKPKRLALSLYKEIITDKIWAYQRDNYGYKLLRSHPLMHSFLGMPFIDVRLSFNSFIPKNLDSKIAQKLVDYYLIKLEQKPHLHDKVEFEIIFSCYDLNTPFKLKNLLNCGFNENEIKRLEFALLELTNNIINPDSGLYLKDLAKISKLGEHYREITESNLPLIDKIYWLLEECKRYGTLPFAGIARAGFVAVAMLNSLVEIGFFSESEKNDFLNSLHTISKELSAEVAKMGENVESQKAFLEKFGHLRAGTYNILSPRYDEAFSEYFSDNFNAKSPHISKFSLSEKRQRELENLFREHGLQITSKEFFNFLKLAIEWREWAKFEFSRLLSKAIVLIGELGENYGINKEEMAHLDINSILELYSSLYALNPKQRFLDEISQNKQEYELTLALKLPSLLRSSEEIFSFFEMQNKPNFITQKSIVADAVGENSKELEGKIVLINAADPGYDYLFSKNIAALITCYGGANSHMAIRASELGLPAAIGVGVELFNKLKGAKKIALDCGSGQIICL